MKARIILAFVLLAAVSLSAQTFRGTILGTVTDPSGAVVSGARVTAKNVATGLERSTDTSADGSYSLRELNIGTYTVTVTPSELRVRKVTHKGKVSEWSLNPVWTSLERDAHEEFGLMGLFLVTRGRKLPVATFLGPVEKESFAKALSAAIGEAKRGPTRS